MGRDHVGCPLQFLEAPVKYPRLGRKVIRHTEMLLGADHQISLDSFHRFSRTHLTFGFLLIGLWAYLHPGLHDVAIVISTVSKCRRQI